MKRLLSLLLAFLLTSAPAFASSFADITIKPTTKATYMASSAFIAPAAATTDIFTLYGSSTKTIKILRIDLNNTCTTASGSFTDKFFLIKRSSAPSGGTSANLTQVPLDSTSAAGTATNCKSYTANPTPGGTVGTLVQGALYGMISTQNNLPSANIFDHKLTGQPIVLRGTAEGVAINFNGVIPAGGTPLLAVTFTWTEE